MQKQLLFIFVVFFSVSVNAQIKKTNDDKPAPAASRFTKDTVSKITDDGIHQNPNNIATISIGEGDLDDDAAQSVSSLLTSARDPFQSAANFNFSSLRFRQRGYERDFFNTYINGVSMDNLDNGATPYALWNGLNDVTRNRDLNIGLRTNSFAYGDIGTSTNIDMRAFKQRKQTEIGYGFSGRNNVHTIDITHATGFNKKGWAFCVSGSRKYADEGAIAGTYTNSWSWYVGIDKAINAKNTISLVAFGSIGEVGRQATAVQETFDLKNDNLYNPSWGWQMGKKRNANVARSNMPVIILSHDFKIDNKTNLLTAASLTTGNRGNSGLDFYNVQNPRPDYYRNLPSYVADSKVEYDQVANKWRTDENVSQINWHKFYEVNRNSIDTINGNIGKRSRYVLGENVTNTTRFNISTVLNRKIGNNVDVTAGATYENQKNKFSKKMLDLLGGDYYVDLNQFAEQFNPLDPNAGQIDLNNINRIIKVGDTYRNNYDINIQKISAWGQVLAKFNKIDAFAAFELSNTQYYRTGYYKNALFPTSSFGKSATQNFDNYAVKLGMTYKINGRNYLYGNISKQTRAPLYNNVFISPNFRNTTQDKVNSEQVNSVEGGYILNSPKFRTRITGYYTEFKNQLDVINFFHDGYRGNVNYALSNINKVTMGLEAGIEAKVIKNVTLNAAAAFGRYYYDSRMYGVTTLDNSAAVLGYDTCYVKDYRLGGSPQEAYTLGITYNSPNFWRMGVSGTFFDNMWVDINPLRRTEKAVASVDYNGAEWHKIVDQRKLNSQFIMDFFANYSWKLPKSYNINHKSTFLVFNFNVNNILDNKNMINTAFEQPRFDFAKNDADKFPPRFGYGLGRTISFSVAFRF
jgi:TonB dependent receptor